MNSTIDEVIKGLKLARKYYKNIKIVCIPEQIIIDHPLLYIKMKDCHFEKMFDLNWILDEDNLFTLFVDGYVTSDNLF